MAFARILLIFLFPLPCIAIRLAEKNKRDESEHQRASSPEMNSHERVITKR
jgi:hypothetical protein